MSAPKELKFADKATQYWYDRCLRVERRMDGLEKEIRRLKYGND